MAKKRQASSSSSDAAERRKASGKRTKEEEKKKGGKKEKEKEKAKEEKKDKEREKEPEKAKDKEREKEKEKEREKEKEKEKEKEREKEKEKEREKDKDREKDKKAKEPPRKRGGSDSKSESDADKRKKKDPKATRRGKDSDSDAGRKRSRSRRARSSSGSASRRRRGTRRSPSRRKKDKRTSSRAARASRSRSKSRKSDRKDHRREKDSKDDKEEASKAPESALGLQGDILQIFSEAAEEVKKAKDSAPATGFDAPPPPGEPSPPPPPPDILGASGPLESSQASAAAGAANGGEPAAPPPRRRKSGWDEGAPPDAPPGGTPLIPGLAGAAAAAAGGLGSVPDPSKVMTIKQEWVGMLIGQKGETLRVVREQSNGANIQIDQSTKDQGFSTLKIFGTPQQVATAETLLLQKISEIDNKQNPQGPHEEMAIDQSTVGYLLGKGGESLKSIKAQSNANVMVDQSTKDQGYTMVKIFGETQAIEVARGLVLQRLAEATDRSARFGQNNPQAGQNGLPPGVLSMTSNGMPISAPLPGAAGMPAAPVAKDYNPADVAAEFRVEQQHVGLLIGKSGATVKQIKERSGATVVIDQSMKHLGYSMCRVMKGPGEDLAKQMVETKLKEAMEADAQRGGPPNLSASDEVRVAQRFVGMLIGRGGEALRSIKDTTGAMVTLDQATKDQGFSIVRISGADPGVISHARSVVESRIAQAQAVDEGRAPPNSMEMMGPGSGMMGPPSSFGGGPCGGMGCKGPGCFGGKGGMPPSLGGPPMNPSFCGSGPPSSFGSGPGSCFGSFGDPKGGMSGKGMPGGPPGMPFMGGPPRPPAPPGMPGCGKGFDFGKGMQPPGIPGLPPMPGGPPMMGGGPMMGCGPGGLPPPGGGLAPPSGGLYDPF
mmetsp:Transcript_48146/g.114443  ORF Transcript_48146/g.114443 Transcript_48146/m.114443 type:complete len:885 (+) Transcript_48146:159-2813(+)